MCVCVCVCMYIYIYKILPEKVMKWSPPERRNRGSPKLTWAEGIRGLMEEKGLLEEDWNDRDNWRKKII